MTSTLCPGGCPVPDPRHLPKLSSQVLHSGTVWYTVARGIHPLFNDTGFGYSRFSPLRDDNNNPVPHLYLARQPVGALLETVFHDIWDGASHVAAAELAGRELRTVRLGTDLRVVDLTDPELARHSLTRTQLVTSSAEHYACTQEWGDHLNAISIGGHPTTGIMWQSRIVELARAATTPLMATLLVADQTEVAVIYQQPGGAPNLKVEDTLGLDTGRGYDLVVELANRIGAVIDPA